MDTVLERILSLIPKDKAGKYVHGEKAKFAKSIGYNDGSIISMWEKGSSVSYTKKLHQIASTYNVSVEWLKGETDDPGAKKETPAHQMVDERLDPKVARLIELYCQLNQKYRELYLQQLETLVLALQDGGQEKDAQD